jgi:hypothetical protein
MEALQITTVPRDQALALVAQRVRDAEVVLDLGSGIKPQWFVPQPLVHLCVDAHRPYLERVQEESKGDQRMVLLHGPWHEVTAMLPDKCVDSVFALDFIEHLEKEEGLRMLAEAERLARVQIVVYTPNGFFPQSHNGPTDRWGMDGGRWQTHRSGWTPEDFGAQWQFVVSPDFIELDEHNQRMETPMGALWAFREVGPVRRRRYVLSGNGAPAWFHTKRAVEAVLPRSLWRLLRAVWLRLRSFASEGRQDRA